MRAAWPQVTIERCDAPAPRIAYGERARIEVSLALAGLAPQDVAVELLLHEMRSPGGVPRALSLSPAASIGGDGPWHYTLDLAPRLCGKLDYRIRAYPAHPPPTHPFETGLMLWL